jgi:hypothetical protein
LAAESRKRQTGRKNLEEEKPQEDRKNLEDIIDSLSPEDLIAIALTEEP